MPHPSRQAIGASAAIAAGAAMNGASAMIAAGAVAMATSLVRY